MSITQTTTVASERKSETGWLYGPTSEWGPDAEQDERQARLRYLDLLFDRHGRPDDN